MSVSRFQWAASGFIAIPVEWNVAARHHCAAFAARQRITGQRGSWYLAQVDRTHSSVPDGGHNCLSDLSTALQLRHKTVGTGTQVASKEKLLAADDSPFGDIE